MGKRQVKEYSAEFKTKVVLEVLKQEQTQAEIASKYKIPSSTIPGWVKHFLENAENVFKGKQIEKHHKENLDKREKHIDELHRKIGELTISVDFLKKNIEKLEFHIRKSLIDTEIKLSITKQCNLLNISRSCLYYKPQSKPAENKKSLKEEIIEIYKEIPFYGYIRTQKELLERGFSCSVKEVRNIRQELGLKTLIPEKQPNYKRNNHNKYPYLLKHFTAKYSNQIWVSDITYIKLRQGMLYKVAIMDIFSRKILGYKISNSLNKAFCVNLLKETIDKYGIPEIFNTDQGSQFTSDEFIKVLKSNGIKVSMDGVGRALDNIFIETEILK